MLGVCLTQLPRFHCHSRNWLITPRVSKNRKFTLLFFVLLLLFLMLSLNYDGSFLHGALFGMSTETVGLCELAMRPAGPGGN